MASPPWSGRARRPRCLRMARGCGSTATPGSSSWRRRSVRVAPLVEALDVERFGGKAASLARSLQAGLTVPPGLALGTTFVDALHHGDPDTAADLRASFARLDGPCAVRSSAI